MKFAPEPEPVEFQVGFGCPSGFVNGFLSDFLGFFQVSSFFFGFFGFLSGFGFLSDFFFGFWVHPRVKNETRTQTRFCVSWVQVRVTGAKMHPNLHPSGASAKPTGYSKPEPELASLANSTSQSKQHTEAACNHGNWLPLPS
jgi:hypothetical protein